jgi:hypothetical protein
MSIEDEKLMWMLDVLKWDVYHKKPPTIDDIINLVDAAWKFKEVAEAAVKVLVDPFFDPPSWDNLRDALVNAGFDREKLYCPIISIP